MSDRKIVRINTTLPAHILELAKQLKNVRGETRSALISRLVSEEAERRGLLPGVVKYPPPSAEHFLVEDRPYTARKRAR